MSVSRDRCEHLRDNFSFQADNFSFLLDIFFLSYRIVFVTNFVTCVRNFVIRITKFVICVTKFVTNFFCADSEKCIGLRKKYLRHSKKHKGYNASLEQVRCAKCLEGILHKKSASKFGAEWQGIGTKFCLFLKQVAIPSVYSCDGLAR